MFEYHFAQLGNRRINELNGIGGGVEFSFGFNNKDNLFFNLNHEKEPISYHVQDRFRTSFKLELYTEIRLDGFEEFEL